jgi:hypothetical protein
MLTLGAAAQRGTVRIWRRGGDCASPFSKSLENRGFTVFSATSPFPRYQAETDIINPNEAIKPKIGTVGTVKSSGGFTLSANCFGAASHHRPLIVSPCGRS